ARYLSDKNVKVLTVNVGESHYKIINYFREYEPAYIVLADYQSVSAKRWQLQGLPTTYVIGPDRKIHYGAIGLLNWKSQTMLNQIVALSQ
ncbi:MAG: redoxin domain-containing protein, partial [Gammaproteobacteria bacterium]